MSQGRACTPDSEMGAMAIEARANDIYHGFGSPHKDGVPQYVCSMCGDRCVDTDPLPGKTDDDIPEGQRSFQERAVYRLCAVCIEDLNEHLGFRMEMRSYQGFKLLWDKVQGDCRSCGGMYTGTWFAPGGMRLADDMCFPCAKVLYNRRLDRSLRRPADFESVDSSVSQILCEVCGRIVYEDVASERSWAYARLADSCIGCKDFDAENRDPFAPSRPFFEPILKIVNKQHKFTACAICGEIGGAWLGFLMDCKTPLCYDHAAKYQEGKEKRGVNIVEEHFDRMAEAFDDDMIDEATDEEAILRRMRWEQLYPRTPEPAQEPEDDEDFDGDIDLERALGYDAIDVFNHLQGGTVLVDSLPSTVDVIEDTDCTSDEEPIQKKRRFE